MNSQLVSRKQAHVFKFLDTDGSGSLEAGDFELVVHNFAREVGTDPSSELLSRYRAFVMGWWDAFRVSADADSDGTVTLDEFCALFSTMATARDKLAETGEIIFDILDSNASGTIGLDEYRRFLRVFNLDDSDAARQFEQFDTDRDGSLSRDEFAVLMVEFFVSDDPKAAGNMLFGPF